MTDYKYLAIYSAKLKQLATFFFLSFNFLFLLCGYFFLTYYFPDHSFTEVDLTDYKYLAIYSAKLKQLAAVANKGESNMGNTNIIANIGESSMHLSFLLVFLHNFLYFLIL